MPDNQKIEEIKKYILGAEKSLDEAKKALFELTGEDVFTTPSKPAVPDFKISENGKVIEGIFNGENMVGPEGKIFSVPANYASKSKLVEGDRLKLTVAEDGSFIYKQIAPVERKKITGELKYDSGSFYVLADGKRYNLLHASITYYKANPGDNVTIVVPADGNSSWAAFENIIHDFNPPNSAEDNPENDIFDTYSPKIDEPDPLLNEEPLKLKEELPASNNPAPSASTAVSQTKVSPNITPITTSIPATSLDPNANENKNSLGETIETGSNGDTPDLDI